jgi:hypothetical protein
MTYRMSHPAARAATAIVSMAAFGAVFFELAAGSVLAGALLCLLTLSAVLWASGRTRRSITAAIDEAEPRPLTVTAVDSAVSLPRPAWNTR